MFQGTVPSDDFSWEDENEDRLWFCLHGRAYGVCSRCDEHED